MIVDPNNNNITLWESGVIVSYLIATYDKSNTLAYASSPEAFQLQQWSYFQASGQGPYFGQAAWYVSLLHIQILSSGLLLSELATVTEYTRFNLFHSEPLPYTRERYNNEIKRVASVLDSHLADRTWLVGDKCTYADLSFVMWDAQIAFIMKDANDPWDPAQYPNFMRWQEAMLTRDSVIIVLEA